MSRPFGIEIEFYPHVEESQMIDNYGYQVYDTNYEEIVENIYSQLRNWDVKDDGSLDEYGMEIASPVFYEDDWREIKKALKVLQNHGAVVDESCGLHVHHDASDLTEHDILRLVESWSNNQEAIDLMVHPSRLDNQYCYPYTEGEIERYKRDLAVNGSIYIEDRYRTLTPQTYHGTVEIRQHESTLDFDEIQAWVLFGRSFIDDVKRRKRPIVKTDPETLMKRTKTIKRSRTILNRKIEKNQKEVMYGS